MIHRAKKSLGQNFLKSEAALRMMCEAGAVTKSDTILEIGPGKGALTEKLLGAGAHVIAVEKDRDLTLILEEKFKKEIDEKKLEIIDGDILRFDPSEHGLKEGQYKIVANIPYNITGAIIRTFLADVIQPACMILLVQKEVAMRIVARDKKESILSLSVKAYGTPTYEMKVGKRFFSPSPKVDSAIVAIKDISRKNFEFHPRLMEEGVGGGDSKINHHPALQAPLLGKEGRNAEEHFFSIVKAGFAHKRKVLRKNLEEVASPDRIKQAFEKLSLGEKVRAEDVPLPIWLALSAYLHGVL